MRYSEQDLDDIRETWNNFKRKVYYTALFLIGFFIFFDVIPNAFRSVKQKQNTVFDPITNTYYVIEDPSISHLTQPYQNHPRTPPYSPYGFRTGPNTPQNYNLHPQNPQKPREPPINPADKVYLLFFKKKFI